MSTPQTGNVILIPVYSGESESAMIEIKWQQSLKSKTANYYSVRAKNQTQGNADVLLYIQDRFYKDESSADFIGKIPGAKKEGGMFPLEKTLRISRRLMPFTDNWVVTLNDRFQYGQKNQTGEKRWVALHDKGNKVFQVRQTHSPRKWSSPG